MVDHSEGDVYELGSSEGLPNAEGELRLLASARNRAKASHVHVIKVTDLVEDRTTE